MLFEKPKIPEQVLKLFTKCDDKEDEDCDDFWLLIKGLRDYVNLKTFNSLPMTGKIPDMTSDTKSYLKLQEIY